MRKPAFRICEKKAADQLRSNCAADQRLRFRYMDTKIPLNSKQLAISCDLFYSMVKFGNMGFSIGKSENIGFFRK